ncbi:MAG: ribokinase family sugar kinase [Roseibaca calidilacus]|uniref:Ribokinase family sugar kinase n=1 Tax=Roseibaca calidilacus TaxID=1666912 RepID=A0A0P7W8I0_9RHOB|nr:PfkB family carbohydrate kinase [Roseibaca calidilacus]KPP93459.1 MAG: ribokinase family sugar kinase [Roseibaca calidilacus]CUX80632.1 Sugar or nucleoside kinase, ribokinase family [Roseibaca calidilacus]
MTDQLQILCIGAALWDIIGRTPAPMRVGSDVAGRITRIPGGVALNIAMALVRAGARPEVLAAVGQDPAGDALVAEMAARGVGVDHLYRAPDLPTDTYMAMEGAGGLIAAIADVHSLEMAGAKVLAPLRDGRLASDAVPWRGMIALDGNLTVALLAEIGSAPAFARADLRVAPASPGKGERLLPLLKRPGTVFYVNLEEAGLLCGTAFEGSVAAARGLLGRGAQRVLVTDGARDTTDASAEGLVTLAPPQVQAARVTGAGDTFMAAHMAAEAGGMDRAAALRHALTVAARYVAGGPEH